MIRLSWINSQQTLENFRSRGGRIVQVLTSKLNILMSQLSSFVASQKLSGQMLNVRSGLLRGSVHPVAATISGTKISASVEAAGSPIGYGNILHEGSRIHQVLASKQRFLRFVVDGIVKFAKSVTIPAQAARPFMTLSEEENTAKIVSELQKSVNEAISED